MTSKEMRAEIKSWVSGLPNREWDRTLVVRIGTRYVTTLSLYSGSRKQKTTIEDYYKENETKIKNCIYQK